MIHVFLFLQIALCLFSFDLIDSQFYSFKTFAKLNYVLIGQDWLKPYAAFCFLRDFFETSDHSEWGRFSQFSKDKVISLLISFHLRLEVGCFSLNLWVYPQIQLLDDIEKMLSLNFLTTISLFLQLEKLIAKDSLQYDVICFHYYIQFHLHLQVSRIDLCHIFYTSSHTVEHKGILFFGTITKLQLSEAAGYARKKGVVLKGDLPIGVDRNSVDTWVYPNLFRMNTATGAPPDYFDKNGQNWGFPTYNWEEMSKDNYAWWQARLTQVLFFK